MKPYERPTLRICGQNVAVDDQVVVAFATERTIALVGVVGTVTRIRVFDEQTGNPITTMRSGGLHEADPELWIKDERTGESVGPIHRSEFETLTQVDGPWCTDQEIEQYMRLPRKDDDRR